MNLIIVDSEEQSKKLMQLVIEYGKACEGMGIATADDDIKEKTYWKHQADDAFYEIKEVMAKMLGYSVKEVA